MYGELLQTGEQNSCPAPARSDGPKGSDFVFPISV